MVQEYRDMSERKAEVREILAQINELELNPTNTPELKQVYEKCAIYTKDGTDIKTKINLNSIQRQAIIELFCNKRAKCSIVLKSI